MFQCKTTLDSEQSMPASAGGETIKMTEMKTLKLTHLIHRLAFFLQFLHEYILVCPHASQTFAMLHGHFPLGHRLLNAFSFKLLPEFSVLNLQKNIQLRDS
jgi:hypothetical protein